MEKQYDSLFEKAVDETNKLKKFLENKKIEVISSAINGNTETVKIKFKNNDDIVQVIHNGDEIKIS